MIDVEYYVEDEETLLNSEFHGFQIDADGLSPGDLFEIDRKAASEAIERYIDDRERLYDGAPAGLKGTNLWLVRGLGRLPASTLWGEFQVYFLFARLRLVLSENPQAVRCIPAVDRDVSDGLESLCEEFDVEYVPEFRDGNAGTNGRSRTSVLHGLKARLHHRTWEVYGRIRPWLILAIFVLVRPLILALYKFTRMRVDVRIWLHPFEDHLTRLYDAPEDLQARGYRTGYALYNFQVMVSLKRFVTTGLETIRRAFEPDRPEPVEWYLKPGKFLGALLEGPRLRDKIRRVGREASERADTPEFAYLARQPETASTRLVVQSLLIERAIEGFSNHVADEIWCIPRGLTKITPRLLATIGERADLTTVGVSPHFTAETRVGYHLTAPEIEGRARKTHPDVYVVFEPWSAETLRTQRPPSWIAVARDKMEAETPESGDSSDFQEEPTSSTSSSISPPDDSRPRVLVILTVPADNTKIVGALESISSDLPDVELVFKLHPLVPREDGIVDGLQDVDIEVTPPEASLADLIGTCDICIAMYSTAAIPALARAIPVVWVPLGSPNHLRTDLITEVGLRADEPDELASAIERLVEDDAFYVEQSRECAEFAREELVPDPDVLSLAELIEEAEQGRE